MQNLKKVQENLQLSQFFLELVESWLNNLINHLSVTPMLFFIKIWANNSKTFQNMILRKNEHILSEPRE